MSSTKSIQKTPANTITDSIIAVLSEDHRVLFAYLYGSAAEKGQGNDIDIAVYAAPEVNFHKLSADLKIALHKKIGLSPDAFDVRVLNGVAERGDIFGLLYLKKVLRDNRLLVDRNPDARAEFLERYGTRFRECEGLMQEVLT
jgi:predicted nucleotidyltransferase